MPTTKSSSRLTISVLAMYALVGCVTTDRVEPSAAELEIQLANYYGASGAVFSPDGRRVAVGTRDKIWVADTATGNQLASLSYLHNSRFGGKKSLQFMDNQRLIVGAQGVILIWDVDKNEVTDKLWLPYPLHTARAITWSESTNLLAYSIGLSGSSVKTARYGEGGFGPTRDLAGFEGVPADLRFSKDGRFLAATGDGNGVFIQEVATGRPAGELPTNGFVTELELFGENRLLVAGADVAFWTFLDADEAQHLDNPELQGQITGQKFARAAGTIALGILAPFEMMLGAFSGEYEGHAVRAAIDLATMPVLTEQQHWCGRSTSISPDGLMLADVFPGITREVIHVYDLMSERAPRNINPKGEYSCAVQFSPDGSQLLITSNKVARLYDTQTWKYRDLNLKER